MKTVIQVALGIPPIVLATAQRRLVHSADIQGIVSLAPDAVDQPMVVAVHRAASIVVDTRSGTRYSDRFHQTTSLTQIGDGDLVQLYGMFDTALGEMIETASVSRIGPDLRRAPTTHAKP